MIPKPLIWRCLLELVFLISLLYSDIAIGLEGAATFEHVKGFEVIYVRNYDADTILVNIPLLPPIFGYHLPVRVKHVDSPEILSDDPCAKALAVRGRDKVQGLLKAARSIKLVNAERDKFFRVLSDVIVDDRINLHEYLLRNKLAVPYEGGLKKTLNWCNIFKKSK